MTARLTWRRAIAHAAIAHAAIAIAVATSGCGGRGGSGSTQIEGATRSELCDAVARPPAFTCPSGTQRRGKPPPEGNEMWCQRWDGTRHGSYRRFPPGADAAREPDFVGDGAVVGEYREGQQHGAWWSRRAGVPSINVAYYEGGKLMQRVTCRP